MNRCPLKNIQKFNKKEYLRKVALNKVDAYLASTFDAADIEIIRQALYNDEDSSDNYRNGWLKNDSMIDELLNSTVNDDSVYTDGENMDDNSPSVNFVNKVNIASVSKKINDVFKVDELRLFKRSFQKEFLKKCIYDVDTRMAVDSSKLNHEIYLWKESLFNDIANSLKITSVSWIDNPTSKELTESINSLMRAVESIIDTEILSDRVKECLYFLSNMDSLLAETGCVDRDPNLKPFEHGLNAYSFSGGKVKMYHNWSTNEHSDINENSSPMLDFLLETLPCVEDGSTKKNIQGLYIGKGLNNFSSLFVQEFLLKHPSYILKQAAINGIYNKGLFSFLEGSKARLLDNKYENRRLLSEEDRILVINHILTSLHNELLKGIYGNTPDGKTNDLYSNSVHGTIADKQNMTFYQTSMKILNGLRTHVFTSDNTGIPMNFKKLLFNQMYKTIQNEYLSTSLNKDGVPDITLLHDKHIKSQSSELTNSLVGRIKYFRRNPKVYQDALAKAGIILNSNDPSKFEIQLINGIELGVTMSVAPSGAFTFVPDRADEKGFMTEGLMHVLKSLMGNYCGLPEIYEYVGGQKVLNKERLYTIDSYARTSFLNTVLPVIGTIIAGSDPTHKMPTNPDDSNTVNLRHQYALNNDFALLQYILNGYENTNVVKSIEGTNLPNYGMRSSIYDYPMMIDHAKQENEEKTNSVFIKNPLTSKPNPLKVVSVTVNDGVDLNKQTKSISQMSAEEMAIQSIFVNFLSGLRSEDQIVYHYTTVDSDKSRQFYIGFDLKNFKIRNVSFATLLDDITSNSDKKQSAINAITEYISEWMFRRSNAVLSDIIESYAEVYSDLELERDSYGPKVSVNNIDSINKYIGGKSVSQIRADFRAAGVTLWEEYHFTQPKGGLVQLNESYIYEWTTHSSVKSTVEWLDVNKRQIAVDIIKNGESIWYTDFNVKVSDKWVNDKKQVIFAKIYDSETNNEIDFGYNAEQYLFNPDGTVNTKYRVELNPVIEAHFYSDSICSNAFNDIYYGFSENQDNKSKGTPAEKLASRISSGYKRTVHAGSTRHHFGRGWGRGCSTHLRAACIEDERVVHSTNVIGESSDLEPQDGGAQRTMAQYFIEKWSLGDAAINYGSAKTIWNDNQQGKSILWKFASYDLTNGVRRASGENGTNSAEDLVRKAYELQDHTDILKTIEFSKYFGPDGEYKGYLYKYNPFTKTYSCITSIKNNDGKVTINMSDCDEKGRIIIGTEKSIPHQLNSLYDVDQILGGAYTMIKGESSLEYSEIQSEILAKIICDNELQEEFVAYILPKSAVKSGRSNMNESVAWKSGYKYDTANRFGDLWTFRMSTEHAGLMMDAEHEVDSSITETSQMISSLTQNGYTKEEANFVYQIIGQIVESSKKVYYENMEDSEDAKRKKLEKFVIDALESTKGTSTGISDSDALATFCRKNNIALPLSAPAVLSKLAPAINSELTKEFIRRSYPGVAAVNAPSYNMIETYKFDNYLYDYTAMCGLLYQDIKGKHVNKYSEYSELLLQNAKNNLINDKDFIEALVHCSWKYIDVLNPESTSSINNPYIIPVTANTEINTGDTIVYRRKNEENFTVERLNSYIQSDEWRHLIDLSDYEVYRWTIKPRNLEQPHLELKVNSNYNDSIKLDQIFTEYDLDTTRAMLYFREYLVAMEKKSVDKISFIDTKLELINKIWTKIVKDLPDSSPYKSELFIDGILSLDPKHVLLKMINFQQKLLRDIGNACKNNYGLELEMQEGFKNKILDYVPPIEYFVQTGQSDVSALAVDYNSDLVALVQSINFLNEFDQKALLDGLTVEQGFLKLIYGNSSNTALIINEFQDVFKSSVDSARMLKFVRSMQKAYELDFREFDSSAFLKQMLRIKDAITGSPFSEGVVYKEWVEQLRWAVEARNLTNDSSATISKITMLAGQVGLPASYAKEYMISQHDQISDILREKENFFRKKLRGMVSSINAPKNSHDFVKVDKHGNAILFKIGNEDTLNSELKNTTEEPIDDYVNVVKLRGEVLCRASLINQGKVNVRRIHNESDSYIVIRCDSVKTAIEVGSSEIFSDRIERFNITGDNVQTLFEYMSHEDNLSRIIDDNGNYHFKHRAEKSNESVKTKTLSQSEFDIIHQSKNEFIALIKEHIIASEKDFITVRAKNLYNSFTDTLKYIGVRTPSQAMQSFMPLEVAIFVGSSGNLVYIPAAMTWFQGADYDIDKSYMMQLGLSGDIVDSGSNLSKRYKFSDLAKLPTPNNNIKFTVSDKVYNPEELVNNLFPVPSETKFYAGSTFVMLSDILHNNVPKYFNTLKTVLNIGNVYESQKVGTHLIFVDDLSNDVTKDTKSNIIQRFKSDLNFHNKTKLYSHWSRVMKNKVMFNAYDLLLNPVNLILESMPIDFGEIGDFAKKTTSGKRETKISGFNFMDKFIICEQAQLGKKEIGIVATGIKSYLVQTNVGNIKMSETITGLKNARSNLERAEALNILAKMMFIRTPESFVIGGDVPKSDYWLELKDSLQEKSKTCVGLLANIDLTPLKDFIKEYTTDGILWGVHLSDLHRNLAAFVTDDEQGINLEALYKELTLSNANEDTLMALSALLSAATDNMKELILSKIRASESTMGLFCTMLMQGYSMTQILNVFASDAFGLIDKFSKTNIFNGASIGGKDTRTIINFLLGTGSLLGSKDWALTSFLQNAEILSQMKVDDDHSLYDSVKEILNGLEEKKGDRNLIKLLRETLLFDNTNSTIILKWLNAKISEIQKARDKQSEYDNYVDEDVDEDDSINDSVWDDDYIDVDPDEFEGETARTRELVEQFTLSDYLVFRQFLEACDYRNSFAESINARRKELQLLVDYILPAAEENKWSGKILKINQGLPKTPDELVKFITSLNAYVNKTLKKNNIRMDRSFDLIDFLEDPEMQKRFIEKFDDIKRQQNILRTVMDSPNFRSMFKVLKDSYDYQRYAYVTRKVNSLLQKYAEEYLPEHDYYQTAITTEEYNSACKVVQEAIESNWLSRLGKTFTVYPGDMVYSRSSSGVTGNTAYSKRSIELTNADQFATFKYLMDNKIFPFLAEQLVELPEFATNEFLTNLKPYSKRLNRRIKATDFYKMDLNMVNIDKSILLRDQYDKILKDFDLIKDIKLDTILEKIGTIDWRIGDWTIGELIYIYDIIQNKGKVGKNSFSKLFENSQNNFLYKNRIEFFNALDNQQFDLPNIQIRDILFNLAWYPDLVTKINGPIYEGDKPKIVVEWNSNHSKIATVKINGDSCQIKDLPSDYTFFATPFTTQVSNINFSGEVDSVLQRYNMTDQVVLKAMYSELERMLSGKNVFVKMIDNETINENPSMFTNQSRIPDYELAPAFYDNDVLYINKSHMTTKEPLYALAEVFSWAMSRLEPWNKFLTTQMPTWNGYENYAKELRNHDSAHVPHMIFGRFVRKYVYDKLIEKPEFVGKKDTTEREINEKMSEALQSIFNLSREFEWDRIAEYNLQDFVGLIGLATKHKDSFHALKLSAKSTAQITALKKQLISEGNLTIIGEC